MSTLQFSEESGSEYTEVTESEEEEAVPAPVFIPKSKRMVNVEERASLEEAKEMEMRLSKEEKRRQSRQVLAESLRRMETSENVIENDDANSDAGIPEVDVSDSDENGLKELIESWKLRELVRLNLEAKEQEEAASELADIERRRKMTDEERYQEDLKAGRFAEKVKSKRKFLQKYYHKGVFYMDESSIRNETDVRLKEYDQPTLEDRYNREALPGVMQVKNFGKRGRTKYTHLVDQDTTIEKEAGKYSYKSEYSSSSNFKKQRVYS